MNLDEYKLFKKYNVINNSYLPKDENLTRMLYNRELDCHPPENQKWLLLLHASYMCNLHCTYCENHALRDEHTDENKCMCEDIMDEETAREIVRKLGPNLREITWHGGEPTILPENLLIAVNDEIEKLGLDITVNLQTNTVAMTAEKEKFLKDLGIEWGVSFDGVFNSQTRGEKSTEAVLNLKKRWEDTNSDRRLGFITVYTADYIDKMIENYEYYKTLNTNDIQSCIVRENVMDGTNDGLVKNDIAVQKVLEYLDYWIHDTDHPIVDRYLLRQVSRLFSGDSTCEESYCVGGWIIIEPTGMIGTCGMNVVDEGWVNIHDINDYHDLIENPKRIQTIYQQKKFLTDHCDKCPWYESCYGACFGLHYEQSHDYTVMNSRICNYTKALLSGVYEQIKNIDVTDVEHYNPEFLNLLKKNNYYSLDECKEIEERYSKDGKHSDN